MDTTIAINVLIERHIGFNLCDQSGINMGAKRIELQERYANDNECY